MNRRTGWAIFLLLILVVLVWFSSHLAALRIYQVDECQNLYMAKVLATGQSNQFFTNASLFLLGPLSWITRSATRSADAFQMARLVFLGVFWLDFFLIAIIAGGRAYSLKTLVAVVAAATLAPLWDYGFEVRHDNLVVLGVLLTWWVVRSQPIGITSYLLAGATAVVLLFLAVKSVVYVLPLAFAIILLPPPAFALPRWRVALAWLAGAILAGTLIRIAYGKSGGWEIYVSVFRMVIHFSAGLKGGGSGFAPWTTLARLLGQTPLLLGVIVAGCYAIITDVLHRRWRAFSWDGLVPEFILFLGAMAALAINPTPYPYNLVHVVPYAFLFAFRYVSSIWAEIWAVSSFRPLITGILVFAHLIPFVIATRRHLDHFNWRQERLMTLAENLTDPVNDRVYDGIGMVPTRLTVSFNWYLHGLNINSFLDGSRPRVCDMLAVRPPAVFIPSYRSDWLSNADQDFIRERYVPLADDFWVLGKMLPAGGGTFEVYHPGRYRISTSKGSDLQDTYELGLKGVMTPEDPGILTGTLDGEPLSGHPVQLSVGTHHLQCAADCQPAVVWMGPRLDRVHRIGPGDHRVLFFNWY